VPRTRNGRPGYKDHIRHPRPAPGIEGLLKRLMVKRRPDRLGSDYGDRRNGVGNKLGNRRVFGRDEFHGSKNLFSRAS